MVAGVEQRIVGLFADIVGFARLDDALLPQFWRSMAAVAGHMRTRPASFAEPAELGRRALRHRRRRAGDR
ncbi:MAG: hypothetical protein R3D28_20210 [Geminicoccaceae bacterium]